MALRRDARSCISHWEVQIFTCASGERHALCCLRERKAGLAARMTFSSIISIETPVLEKAGKPCLSHEAESVECRKRDGRSGEDKPEMLCDLHREKSSLVDRSLQVEGFGVKRSVSFLTWLAGLMTGNSLWIWWNIPFL